ncbi:DUF4232 domain-containing protein [Streptomyces sp. NRRL S-1448]|uniref:DUF4232 domain-containing protein n=1 Tax=Streptomyces sp. NRRL S-1448 TaxID=1463883 RepID=UPI0004C02572|nr:DUF4232 domain-containing protein [Streptomyces sp. NRRL S-1448]
MSSTTTVRTARRRTLRIAAAALTAAAGLTLTACSGSDADGTKAASRSDSGMAAAESSGAGSSAGAQGSDAQAGPGAKVDGKAGPAADKQSDKQSGSAHASGGGGAAGSGVQRCHTSGLKAVFATGEDATPDPNAGGATTTSIVLTNKGSRTCVIGGFAGVDLKSRNGGQIWSLARSSAKHGSITLKPGDSTDFTINLGMAGKNEEHPWVPAFAAVTPPNETTSLTLKWPWGPLVDQTGATHPATFVNPIG